MDVERQEIEARSYDIKAVKPDRKRDEDTRSPDELLDLIEAKSRDVDAAIIELRRLL